jgi:hypothetical protein
MADAIGATFSFGIAAPSIVWGTMDTAMVELLFMGSTGAQSAAGDCTALVVHEPIPGVARPAPLR